MVRIHCPCYIRRSVHTGVLMIASRSKNAIVVVEFARELKELGVIASERSIGVTRRRSCPIAITSLAFIAGAVPS